MFVLHQIMNKILYSLALAFLMISVGAFSTIASDSGSEGEIGLELLFAGPLVGPDFDSDSRTPGSGDIVSNNQPTISIRIFSNSDQVVGDSIIMTISGCDTNGGAFEGGDTGVRYNGSSAVQSLYTAVVFSVDFEDVGCELPNGTVTVSVSARTDFGDITESEDWSFTVDVPNEPAPPSQPGPAPFRIDSVAPTFAFAGGEVTVRGAGFERPQTVSGFLGVSHFFPGTDVIFNGQFLNADISNSGELTFQIPENTGCGFFPLQLFNRMIPLVPDFEVPEFSNVELVQIQCLLIIPTIPAAPEIDRLEPSSGPIGTEVRVIGTGDPNTGFYENTEGEALSVVLFAGNPNDPESGLELNTTYIGDHELRFQVPDDFECGLSYSVQVRGPGQMITNPFYSNFAAFQVTCEEEGGIEFANPLPTPGLFTIDPGTLPEISVEVTTTAPGASIVPSSLKMTIDQCPGLLFETSFGAQFNNNIFSLDLANIDFINLPSPPCLLSVNSSPNVTVVAEDSLGNEAEYSWSFNVLAQENEVTIDLDYFPNNPRVTDEMTFNATVNNTNGTILFYHWFLDDDADEINDPNNNGDAANCNQPCTEVTWDDPEIGPHTMAVRISSNNEILGWTSVNFTVAQANGNLPPVVSLTYVQACHNQNSIFAATFTAVAEDPDGDFLNPLNFEWYVNDLNDGIPNNFERLFNNNGNPVNGDQIVVNFGAPDEYSFRVVVPDGNGGVGQAEVEITIPNGPSPSPSPSPMPQARPLHLALDLNNDGMFDDQEIQIAIAYWAQGEMVPEADDTISDCLMKQLTEMWITGKPLAEFDPLKCGAASRASISINPIQLNLSKPVQLTAPSLLLRQINLQQSMAEIRVQVFDLEGRVLVDEFGAGAALRFMLLSKEGSPFANGTYFYVVNTVAYDGQTWRSDVRKLIVFR